MNIEFYFDDKGVNSVIKSLESQLDDIYEMIDELVTYQDGGKQYQDKTNELEQQKKWIERFLIQLQNQ